MIRVEKDKWRKLILVCLVFVSILSPSQTYAQEDEGGGEDDFFSSSLTDFGIVIGSGVFGAILGLSTLSFVDEPKDHLKNILVGGAIGVIIGVGIVAYTAARKGKSGYEGGDEAYYWKKQTEKELVFSGANRVKWHVDMVEKQWDHRERITRDMKTSPQLTFAFSF